MAEPVLRRIPVIVQRAMTVTPTAKNVIENHQFFKSTTDRHTSTDRFNLLYFLWAVLSDNTDFVKELEQVG